MAYKCMKATIRVLLSFALMFLTPASFADSDDELMIRKIELQVESIPLEPVEISFEFAKDGISDDDHSKLEKFLGEFRDLNDSQKILFLKTMTLNMDYLTAELKSLEHKIIMDEKGSTEQARVVRRKVYESSFKVLGASMAALYTAGFLRFGFERGSILKSSISRTNFAWIFRKDSFLANFQTKYSSRTGFIPSKSMHFARAGSWGFLAVGAIGVLHSIPLLVVGDSISVELSEYERTKLINSIEQKNQEMKGVLAILEALRDVPMAIADEPASDETVQFNTEQIAQIESLSRDFYSKDDGERADFLGELKQKIDESIAKLKSTEKSIVKSDTFLYTPEGQRNREFFRVSTGTFLASSIALGASMLINQMILNEAAKVGIGETKFRVGDFRLIRFTLGLYPTVSMNSLNGAKNIGRTTALGKVARVGMFSLGIGGLIGIHDSLRLMAESSKGDIRLSPKQRRKLVDKLESEREIIESLEYTYRALSGTTN